MLRELGIHAEPTENYLRIKGEHKLIERLHNYGLESHRLQKDLKSLRAKEIKKMQKENITNESSGVDDDESASPSQSSKCKLRVLVPR